jgi:sucrose phosphorylase
VGLFAGCNDMPLLARTSTGRDINRHYYSRAEIDIAIASPVVARLFDLIRLRNSHSAFAGRFTLAESADPVIDLRWENGSDFASLHIDLRDLSHRLDYSTPQGQSRLQLADGMHKRLS